MNQETEGRGFLRSFLIETPDHKEYPYSIPALSQSKEVTLGSEVTFFVGENGSGKSTIIEALAVNAGFNPEGGSKNFNFSTRDSHSTLHETLRIVRNPGRERTGFFLRAESFFNVASAIEKLDEGGGGAPIISNYGGVSLHEQSHGESFLALVQHRFGEKGLYILDEPEAALSPGRQLALLTHMSKLVKEGSQFIIATHSPILLAYPHATIYKLDTNGITQIKYEDTDAYLLTRDFLNHTELYINKLI